MSRRNEVKADHGGGSDQIFYGEFDGRRRKRALVKIIGMIAGNRGGVFGRTPALVSLVSCNPFPSPHTQGNAQAAERVAVEDGFRIVPPDAVMQSVPIQGGSAIVI